MQFGKFFRSRLLCLARRGNSAKSQETVWMGFGWLSRSEIMGLVNPEFNQLPILVNDIQLLPVNARGELLFGIGVMLAI
jgi:hypothetical protein